MSEVRELTTVEKIKVAYDLIQLLDDSGLKDIMHGMKSGERAYNLLKASIEKEVESLMGQNQTAEIKAASTEVASIVENIRMLQESLMQIVQRSLNLQPGAAAQPQHAVPTQRPRPQARVRGLPQGTLLPDEIEAQLNNIPLPHESDYFG